MLGFELVTFQSRFSCYNHTIRAASKALNDCLPCLWSDWLSSWSTLIEEDEQQDRPFVVYQLKYWCTHAAETKSFIFTDWVAYCRSSGSSSSYKVHRDLTRLEHLFIDRKQCDQVARLFFNTWAIYDDQNLPNGKLFAKVVSKYYLIQN